MLSLTLRMMQANKIYFKMIEKMINRKESVHSDKEVSEDDNEN